MRSRLRRSPIGRRAEPGDTGVAHAERLAQLWAELLSVPSVQLSDSFIALGGHSLTWPGWRHGSGGSSRSQSSSVCSRLRGRFGKWLRHRPAPGGRAAGGSTGEQTAPESDGTSRDSNKRRREFRRTYGRAALAAVGLVLASNLALYALASSVETGRQRARRKGASPPRGTRSRQRGAKGERAGLRVVVDAVRFSAQGLRRGRKAVRQAD